MVYMKNNIVLFIIVLFYASLQANSVDEHQTLKDLNIFEAYLFNRQTLKELNLNLEIIELEKWDNNIEVLGDLRDTNEYCAHIGSPQKNKTQLKEYFVNSVFINPNYVGYYGIWQCDYRGKVKLFNQIWDFSSVSGSTRLSRKIPINQASKQSNNFDIYCYEGICYEVMYLVCEDELCKPRATVGER